MDKNIREKIVDTAQAMFLEKDYDSVTMRDIAGRLGISVGNLTYHYPKKEDILMTIHDRVFGQFLRRLSPEWRVQHGITGFFAAEYAFHHFIVNSAGYYRIYNQVINSPVMRFDYYDRPSRLLLTFLEQDGPAPGGNTGQTETTLRNAVTAMSSLEFQFMETGAFSADFDGSFRKLVPAVLLFLAPPRDNEKNPCIPFENADRIAGEAIEEGKTLGTVLG